MAALHGGGGGLGEIVRVNLRSDVSAHVGCFDPGAQGVARSRLQGHVLAVDADGFGIGAVDAETRAAFVLLARIQGDAVRQAPVRQRVEQSVAQQIGVVFGSGGRLRFPRPGFAQGITEIDTHRVEP